jgi:hypothetical protein
MLNPNYNAWLIVVNDSVLKSRFLSSISSEYIHGLDII